MSVWKVKGSSAQWNTLTLKGLSGEKKGALKKSGIKREVSKMCSLAMVGVGITVWKAAADRGGQKLLFEVSGSEPKLKQMQPRQVGDGEMLRGIQTLGNFSHLLRFPYLPRLTREKEGADLQIAPPPPTSEHPLLQSRDGQLCLWLGFTLHKRFFCSAFLKPLLNI